VPRPSRLSAQRERCTCRELARSPEAGGVAVSIDRFDQRRARDRGRSRHGLDRGEATERRIGLERGADGLEKIVERSVASGKINSSTIRGAISGARQKISGSRSPLTSIVMPVMNRRAP
jgi:hypothetical protein